MNKKTLLIILGVVVVGAAAAFFMLRKGSSKHLQLVPSDASMVISFNLRQLADKADFNGKLKESKLFKTMMKEMKDESRSGMSSIMKEILKNPMGCGLDARSNMYIFMQSGKDNNNTMGIVFDMKDMRTFNEFLKKIPNVSKHITDQKTYFLYNEGSDFFAFNDKGMLILEKTSMYGDEKKAATMKSYASLMAQDKKASILDKKEFKTCMDDKKDIGLYMNYGELMSMYGSMTRGNDLFKKMMESYEGIYVSGGVNFENDKVNFSVKLEGDKKAIDKITYMNKKGVDGKASQFITNDKVFALISTSLDLPKLIDMLSKDKDMMDGLTQTAQGMGMTVSDLKSILSGDIVIALVDVIGMERKSWDYQMNEATGQYEMIEKMVMQPMPVFTVNIGVKDKAKFGKMLNTMLPIPVIDGMRKMPIPMIGINMFAVENEFGMTLTNDSNLAATMVTGKKLKKEPAKDIAGPMTDKPASFFMDLNVNNYPPTLTSFMAESMGEDYNYFKSYMSIFNNIKGDGGMQEASYDINMTKGDGNSLYRILKQFDVLPIDEK